MRSVISFVAAIALLVGDGGVVFAEGANSPLVWPAPPAAARIQYVKSIATVKDVEGKKGVFGRIWDMIVGDEQVQLRKPMGVAVDGDGGWVAVADPAEKRVHVFDQKNGSYWAITSIDKLALDHPMAVASDGKGTLYVADSGRGEVYRMTGARTLSKVYGGKGVLKRPTAVAVNSVGGRLYVTDTPEHNIKVFDLGDGTLKGTIGSRGTLDGQLNYPSYLAVDAHGNLYVTDALNGRIQVFDQEGRFVRRIGQHGDGSGDFSAPKGVALDSDGHLYVADADFDNVQIFNNEGRLLLFFGSSGQGPGRFWMPTGLAMDLNDRLYVADSYNKRIQVFQYLKEAVER